MELTPEALRARFSDLGDQRESILGQSTPLREQRDQILADTQAQIDALDGEIRSAETGLFDIDQERGLIARALGGRTSLS